MLWYLAGSYLILLEVPNHNFAKKSKCSWWLSNRILNLTAMCLTWYHRLRLTCPSAVQDWKVLRLPTVSKYCWDLALPICGTCDVYLGSILMNLLRCAYALPKLATTGCRKRFSTSWMLPERSLGLSNILVDLLLIRTGNWKFLLDKSVIWGCQSRWPWFTLPSSKPSLASITWTILYPTPGVSQSLGSCETMFALPQVKAPRCWAEGEKAHAQSTWPSSGQKGCQ